MVLAMKVIILLIISNFRASILCIRSIKLLGVYFIEIGQLLQASWHLFLLEPKRLQFVMMQHLQGSHFN